MERIVDFVVEPWMFLGGGYLLVQAAALVRLAGTMRTLSLMLTVVMLTVCAMAGAAFYLEPSNLWRMMLGLATPPALVMAVGLLAIGMVLGRGGRPPTRAHAVLPHPASSWPS